MGDVERRFVEGDVAAFEALFKAYQREVYGWIVRLVRDPAAAEDLTIETFWRIYRSRARRITATLALVEERPYQEIAEMLGVSLGTVKSRVFRATRRLRETLTREGWQS